jgi:hypothetical protein
MRRLWLGRRSQGVSQTLSTTITQSIARSASGGEGAAKPALVNWQSPTFKAGRASQPDAWKVRFLRRLVERKGLIANLLGRREVSPTGGVVRTAGRPGATGLEGGKNLLRECREEKDPWTPKLP